MNPAFGDYGLKDLLPLKLDVPDEGCIRSNRSQFCFDAGEYHYNIKCAPRNYILFCIAIFDLSLYFK